LKTHWKLFFL